jgi:hypothetical protein
MSSASSVAHGATGLPPESVSPHGPNMQHCIVGWPSHCEYSRARFFVHLPVYMVVAWCFASADEGSVMFSCDAGSVRRQEVCAV